MTLAVIKGAWNSHGVEIAIGGGLATHAVSLGSCVGVDGVDAVEGPKGKGVLCHLW